MFPAKKSPKISNNFYCECCDYKCSKKSEYTKHNLTAKHKNLQNPTDVTVSLSDFHFIQQ